MRIVDVDAHFLEPLDWLSQVDTQLHAALPPSMVDPRVPGARTTKEELEEELALVVSPELVPLEVDARRVLSTTWTTGMNPYFDAVARIKVMDAEGIDAQFLNPTHGPSDAIAAATMSGKTDLLPRLRGAWNTFAGNQVAGHTDRLIPVTQLDLNDLEWSLQEMKRMRAMGSRAFNVRQPRENSITHPDFDVLWSTAEDLEMAAYVHIGLGNTTVDPIYAKNGRNPYTYSRLNRVFEGDVIGMPLSPQVFLSAMVLDGVLERHPGLNVIVAESGYHFLPSLMKCLDWCTSKGNYLPEIDRGGVEERWYSGHAYDLPLCPSDYIRRQVRITPVVGAVEKVPWEAAAMTRTMAELREIDALHVLVFSSDYPHPEGRTRAISVFDSLPFDAEECKSFFGASAADLMRV